MQGNTDERQIWENLSEWDDLENPLAPLTEDQQKSIIELASLCDNSLTLHEDVVSQLIH